MNEHAREDRHERLLRYLERDLSEEERFKLERELQSSPELRMELRRLAEHAVVIADEARAEGARQEAASTRNGEVGVKRPMAWVMPLSLASGILVLIALLGVMRFRVVVEPIVEVIEYSGAVIWVGADGRMTALEDQGRSLPAGTLETLSENSSVKIVFRDGSEIMLSSVGRITFSEEEEGKAIYLGSGVLIAEIAKQPDGRPFRIDTGIATLEVLGTRFEVESTIEATHLAVVDGTVKLTRVIDGASVEVEAAQEAVATLNRKETLQSVEAPRPVFSWSSDFLTDSETVAGKWLPEAEAEGKGARLQARPVFLPSSSNGPVTIYRVGTRVRRAKQAPLELKSESVVRVEGYLQAEASLEVMLAIFDRENEGSGNYFRRTPLLPAGPFAVELSAGDFRKWLASGNITLSERPRLRELIVYTIDTDAGLEVEALSVTLDSGEWDP